MSTNSEGQQISDGAEISETETTAHATDDIVSAAPNRIPDPVVGSSPNDKEGDVDEDQLLERMRGDAVGDTMYSRKFILQTLVKLSQLEGSLGQELEDDLCKVWDMSVSTEVVSLLLENDAIELFMYVIEGSEDVRLYEILVGLLGNMCMQVECVVHLTAHPDWIETLLKLNTCMDRCMLIQLMHLYHLIMSHVKTGKEQLGIDWYNCLAAFDSSAKNFGFILQQSVSVELLRDALKAVNAVLATCALVEEENIDSGAKLKPFAEVFLVQELCDGVNNAFLRLMQGDPAKQAEENVNGRSIKEIDDDTDHDADVGYESTRDTIVIETYLNITTILVQLPEVLAVDSYVLKVMSCLTCILKFLQQPMQLTPLGERQEYLEDLTHICNCLQYFYDKDTFLNLLNVWLQMKLHIEKYSESVENDFEAVEDDPVDHYVDSASKLLRLLANMLLKIKEGENIEVNEQKAQLFLGALNSEQDAVFKNAYTRMKSLFDKTTESPK
ncbi:uncharacterized protein LOC115625611 [Scaptodrosophila lebanonensis]|uniref:Uncharacterized protein LOC115625611 n=1 Tax=Drosophila lebanonensis TaxID=7225 RepID=A0A6J2TM69_DROLE|nr:uncharacterized protein LOC115625611 [Scaptodrosophila lebanonensis]